MYNRYIPQPDGSYRRSHVQDQARPPEPPRSAPCPPVPPPCPPEPRQESNAKQPSPHMGQKRPYRPPQRKPEPEPAGIGHFLRQLLPKDFDTADLIVVLLLLLMSADSCDDQNNALLTLALYLFL